MLGKWIIVVVTILLFVVVILFAKGVVDFTCCGMAVY